MSVGLRVAMVLVSCALPTTVRHTSVGRVTWVVCNAAISIYCLPSVFQLVPDNCLSNSEFGLSVFVFGVPDGLGTTGAVGLPTVDR